MDGACLGELVPIAKLTRGNLPWRRNRLSPFKVPSRKSHYEARRLELTQQLALFKMEEREMPMTRKDYLLQEGLGGASPSATSGSVSWSSARPTGARQAALQVRPHLQGDAPVQDGSGRGAGQGQVGGPQGCPQAATPRRPPHARAKGLLGRARDAAYAAQVERDRIEKERAEAIMLKHGLRPRSCNRSSSSISSTQYTS